MLVSVSIIQALFLYVGWSDVGWPPWFNRVQQQILESKQYLTDKAMLFICNKFMQRKWSRLRTRKYIIIQFIWMKKALKEENNVFVRRRLMLASTDRMRLLMRTLIKLSSPVYSSWICLAIGWSAETNSCSVTTYFPLLDCVVMRRHSSLYCSVAVRVCLHEKHLSLTLKSCRNHKLLNSMVLHNLNYFLNILFSRR